MINSRLAVAAAIAVAIGASAATAQTAPEGTCEFFVDPEFGGAGGQYPSGQGAYLAPEGEVAEALLNSNTLADYQMFNSPELAGALSSVRVGPGCMAGWATPANGEFGYTETSEDYGQFAPNTDDAAVAVYCQCN